MTACLVSVRVLSICVRRGCPQQVRGKVLGRVRKKTLWQAKGVRGTYGITHMFLLEANSHALESVGNWFWTLRVSPIGRMSRKFDFVLWMGRRLKQG